MSSHARVHSFGDQKEVRKKKEKKKKKRSNNVGDNIVGIY